MRAQALAPLDRACVSQMAHLRNDQSVRKIIDDLQLMLVHPPGHGDHNEPEGIQDSWHLLLNYPQPDDCDQPVFFHADPISGPYAERTCSQACVADC